MVEKMNIVMATVFLQLSRLIRMSYIFGSKLAFFSAVNITAPLVGIFSGIHILVTYSFIRSALEFLLLGVNPIFSLLYHSSNIFASFYWKHDSILARIALPLTATAIFILHPSGSIFYAMLWLIPILLSPFDSIFLKSLGATFNAHAFGSIIYLLAGANVVWNAIIPVALLERLLFATGIAVGYKICVAVRMLRPSLRRGFGGQAGPLVLSLTKGQHERFSLPPFALSLSKGANNLQNKKA